MGLEASPGPLGDGGVLMRGGPGVPGVAGLGLVARDLLGHAILALAWLLPLLGVLGWEVGGGLNVLRSPGVRSGMVAIVRSGLVRPPTLGIWWLLLPM